MNFKIKQILLIFIVSISSITLIAQDNSKQERKEIERVMKAYKNCSLFRLGFENGLSERYSKNKEEFLIRETDDGNKQVSRTDSYNILFVFFLDILAFKDSPWSSVPIFVNVRPDRSKSVEYDKDKGVTLQWMKYITKHSSHHADPTAPHVEREFNGFNVISTDATKLSTSNNLGTTNRGFFEGKGGGTIETNVMFDDSNKMITTFYFFEMPHTPKYFTTIEEWRILRDKFLNGYTKCVTDNLAKK